MRGKSEYDLEKKKIIFTLRRNLIPDLFPGWKSSGICDSVKIILEGQIKNSRPDFKLASTSKLVLKDVTCSCFNVDQLLRGHN